MKRLLTRLWPLVTVLGVNAGATAFDPLQSPPTAAKRDCLAIIVNQANPVENLSFAELRKIFLGQRAYWPDSRKITLAIPERGQPEREAALRRIYLMKEGDLSNYFLHATFTGEVQSPPKVLNTAAGVRKFVSLVPGAIGLVSLEEVDGSVKVVKVDGLRPDDPHYKFAAKTH